MKKSLTLLLSAMLVCAGFCSCGGEKDKASVSDGGTSASSNACSDSEEGGQGSDEVKKIDVTNGLKLLFIGNSFADDTRTYMLEIMRGFGVSEVTIGLLYIGGSTMQQHLQNAKDGNAAYVYYKGGGGSAEWTQESNKTLEYGLKDEKWDVVSLQSTSCFGGSEIYMDDATIVGLTSYVNETTDNKDLKIVYHMTWAYLDESTDSSFIALHEKNHDVHYRNVCRVTKNVVLPRSEFYMVIPTGTAVENAYGSSLRNVLYRDSVHLSFLQGRYLAGLAYTCALIGRSPDEATYRPMGITDGEFALIKKCAAAAIGTPFEKSDIAEV